MNERRNPYDRGPWKPGEARGLVLGGAILAGGIYGLSRLFISGAHPTGSGVSAAGYERGARFR